MNHHCIISSDDFGKGDYAEASPCIIASLPQKPIPVNCATQNGFQHRVDTELLSFQQDEKTRRVESVIEDLIAKQKFLVRSKDVCGADVASSRIVRDLRLPLHNLPGGGPFDQPTHRSGHGETLTLAQSVGEG